jgi:4a-hydroxytetrahydrobiopterin dehydratase
MKRLEAKEVRASLAAVPEWTRVRKAIRRTYAFPDFLGAMKFVNAVARAAEKAQHHPDVDIRWGRVTLILTTHDAGGLTELDFQMAALSDRLALRHSVEQVYSR